MLPNTSVPATIPPPQHIHDIFNRICQQAGPNAGHASSRSATAGPIKRALTFRQKLLMASFGCFTEDDIQLHYSNADFNRQLDLGRSYRRDFEAKHGSKPASTFLFAITSRIHDGDMPDHATASHATIMSLWIVAAGSLRADTAIALIYDFGMEADTVLDFDQDVALATL
ncbi:hypothetical protein Vretimale_8808 [Volvox reticuliferus]|uniref:Uncharacterized protein n=1 Tax=Volvox reticuliferus TaxID=1737510 RepID=A0A8J4LPP8_9CHLO|nr:hypothetical protein Vretimale_8808 [Volvox reticuliferus]